MKRLIPFLILNIIVSAITTLLVLSWWEQNHDLRLPWSGSTPAAAQTVQPAETALPAVQATLPSLDEEWIRVDTVIGAGDLNNEVVVLVREGEQDLLLTNWQLVDEQGRRFTLPDLLLSRNGSVRIYTRSGENTVTELYWGLDQPVWQHGETVTVVDSEGATRATYQIP